MTTARQRLGKHGEDLAARYLQAQGYLILARNVRTPYGELDLVARQGEVVVFVEVKTRRNDAFGMPEDAVGFRKQARLLASAQAYLQAHPDLPGHWRVDVIAIRLRPGHSPEVRHFENAIHD